MKIYNLQQFLTEIRKKNAKIELMCSIDSTYDIIINSFVTINGNGHKINFLNFGSGINIKGNHNKIIDLEITNSSKTGIRITGNHNIIKSVKTSSNKRTGIQICKGGSYNKIINCISAINNSNTNDADGFACKLDSGKGNIFIKCTSFYNEDDGFDLFAARHSVKFYNCVAIGNGASGFKLGGIRDETDLNYNIYHKLYSCSAYCNKLYGFTSNNQVGKIMLKKCLASKNIKEGYFFPKVSHPKALSKKDLILGKTNIYHSFVSGTVNVLGCKKNNLISL